MRKLLVIAAAGAALGCAGSANAQYAGQYGYQSQYGSGYGGGSDWNNARAGYSRFEQQYRHDIDGIRHGLSDGSFSRSQANNFYRELEGIRRDAYRSQRYGNYQDGYIQARMARLHQRMHLRHERDHERNAYGYGGYGGYQSGYGGYNQGDRDDNHHHDEDDD